MRVLLIGSGGREHALAWALSASPLLTKLWVAPGNPGIAALAETVPIAADDLSGLVEFALENDVDLVIPGPEAPLVAGLADGMAEALIECCGPTKAAARLEGSKAFAKEVAEAAGVPTARFEVFTDAELARDFATRRGAPLVVKADGLAGGKGVVVAATEAEALEAIDRLIAAGPVLTRSSWGRRGTTSGWETATRGRTRAGWGRSRRPPTSIRRRPWTASSARSWQKCCAAARRSAACCSPA